jgi:hypothetical protein
MKKFIKKVLGIDKLEAEKLVAQEQLAAAISATEEAKKAEEIARMTPKERATLRGEPWVAVLDTKVNPDNVRNGFFELDWNELFVAELIKAGYGFEADPEEEIIDRWFRDLARNLLAEENQDVSRASGYINVNRINKNQSEIS